MLETRDFDNLQRETEAFQRNYEKNKISGDEYFAVLDAVASAHVPSKFAELWLEKYPKSYAARFVLGRIIRKIAWQNRGGNFATATKESQLVAFQKGLEDAEEQFLQSRILTAKPYPSYCELIEIANNLGNGMEESYFKRAVAIDPKAYCAYSAYLNALAPKWGGSIQQVEAAVAAAKSSNLTPENIKHVEALGLEIRGDDAQIRGDYDSAIELYRQAFVTSPGRNKLRRLIRAATLAQKAGYPDQAISLCTEAIEIDPSNSSAHWVRGQVLETMKRDVKAALADYLIVADSVAAGEGDSGKLRYVGQIFMEGRGGVPQDFDQAEKYFRIAESRGDQYVKRQLDYLAILRKSRSFSPPSVGIKADRSIDN